MRLSTYLIYCLLSISTIVINSIALKYWRHRWNAWLGYGIPTLGIAIFLFSTFYYSELSDFTKAYYPAGRLISL